MQLQGKTFTAKKKLFIIADAGADTGFANVTHNLIENLHTKWDISVLAINYYGDPHPMQEKAKLYNPTAKIQGDYYGIERLADLLTKIKPDLIFIINDPWIAAQYIDMIEKYDAPKILYTPIDATDIDDSYVLPLNKFNHIIAYTEFGKRELLKAGLQKPISVISHGVNTKLYKPIDKHEARSRNGFSDDWFIVNITDRNQIRKRIDLALYYFAEWVHTTNKPNTVKIHYHGAIQDEGWDLLKLARKLNLSGAKDTKDDRFIITSPHITGREGIPLELMPFVYGVADIGISATMGEGWGMTVHERMAMRIPMIVPEYSALSEWPKGGVHYVALSDIPFFNIRGLNTRGAIPEKQSMIDALDLLYTDKDYRQSLADKGYKIATDKRFYWHIIADQFNNVFRNALMETIE